MHSIRVVSNYCFIFDPPIREGVEFERERNTKQKCEQILLGGSHAAMANKRLITAR
jgi:hypothetical protein